MELEIARNPDPDSSLPYLNRVPVDGGLVFRTEDTWPRTSAAFCYPVSRTEWPAEPDVVERVALRSCSRRGAAIDVVADRTRVWREPELARTDGSRTTTSESRTDAPLIYGQRAPREIKPRAARMAKPRPKPA